MAKHPALQMSRTRQDVWINEASPEDFFAHLDLLAALYAKKVYRDKEKRKQYGQYNGDVLLQHYNEHKQKTRKDVSDETKSW